jgi:hypothetical protein
VSFAANDHKQKTRRENVMRVERRMKLQRLQIAKKSSRSARPRRKQASFS